MPKNTPEQPLGAIALLEVGQRFIVVQHRVCGTDADTGEKHVHTVELAHPITELAEVQAQIARNL